MKKEYNFAEMEGRKNPYAKGLKKQVSLRSGVDVEARKHTNPQLTQSS